MGDKFDAAHGTAMPAGSYGTVAPGIDQGTIKLDTSTSPRQIDTKGQNDYLMKGIYKFENGEMKVCFGFSGNGSSWICPRRNRAPLSWIWPRRLFAASDMRHAPR